MACERQELYSLIFKFFYQPWVVFFISIHWSVFDSILKREPRQKSRVSLCVDFSSPVLCPDFQLTGLTGLSVPSPQLRVCGRICLGFSSLCHGFFMSKLGRLQGSSHWFLSLRDLYPSLPDEQCFENHIFIYFVYVSGEGLFNPYYCILIDIKSSSIINF